MRHKNTLVWIILAGASLCGYQNCQDKTFMPSSSSPATSQSAVNGQSAPSPGVTTTDPSAPATSSPSSNTCTLQNIATTTQLKILFVVDNSGSTANTDPSNQYRILAVQNLIAKYGANPNFQYGYSYFSGTDGSTAAYGTWDFDTKTNSFFSFQVTSNSSNTSVNYADSVVPSLKSYSPFGNVSSLQSALSAFENLGAGGHTPYKAAFAAISNIVMQDLATASDPKGTSYAVVFMSDGGPSDLAVQQDSDFSQVISKNVSELQTIVQDLRSSVGAKGSSITVSSVYFGPESGADGGIANIQAIANTGGGQFVDTNVTQQLDFSSLISYSGTGCN